MCGDGKAESVRKKTLLPSIAFYFLRNRIMKKTGVYLVQYSFQYGLSRNLEKWQAHLILKLKSWRRQNLQTEKFIYLEN